MREISAYVLEGLGTFVVLAFGIFAIVSLREKEMRAAAVSFGFSASGFALIFAAGLPFSTRLAIVAILGMTAAALAAAALLPFGRIKFGNQVPVQRFDERDIMFARARLKPGTPEFESYYAMRPQNRVSDDLSRSKPGLLSQEGQEAEPFLFASAQAGSELTEALRGCVEGPVADIKQSLPPARMTSFIKNLARYYGAPDVGVTELRSYHIYTHIGRGEGAYGAPVLLEHKYAIALTVEMDFRMIAGNPAAPGVVESIKQYVEAARVAIQLANYIRRLGHPARAHIDGNYRVIAPLVARDAGLGEIGRMGLLMTPRLGPRVRIAVVTTDLELVPDLPSRDTAVIDFCTVCRKCVDNCPVHAIPFGGREECDGVLRWRINPDTCYRYWCVVGTDCGRCMTVCPYSHPDSTIHNLVRWGIRNSGFFRRAAYRMDNLLYGRKPSSHGRPAWTRVA
jgi:ferredoxin